MLALFSAILSAFVSLLDHVKENPWRVATLALACFMVVMMFRIGDRVDAIAHPTQAVEAQRFEQGLITNAIIQDKLAELRVKTGSDRALVRQYHNGTQSISGIPFLSVTTTHFSASRVSSSPDLGSYPSASLNQTLTKIWRNGEPSCIVSDIEGVRSDAAFYAYLNESGVKRFIMCPMVGMSGGYMGHISLNIHEDGAFWQSDETAMRHGEQTAYEIARQLERVRDGDRKNPWWQVW